jgi:HEAT repeat protein
LAEISTKSSDFIKLDTIIEMFMNEKSPSVKRELTRVLSSLSPKEAEDIKKYLNFIFVALSDSDTGVRGSVASILPLIAENHRNLVPFEKVELLFDKQDSKIKEAVVKTIGYIGGQKPKKAIELLKNALSDKDWSIKNAATQSMARLSTNTDGSELGILKEIKAMLNDKDKWTKMKVFEVLTEIGENDTERIKDIISIDDLKGILTNNNEDPDIIINGAKLFGITARADFKKAYPTIITLFANRNQKIRDAMISGLIKTVDKVPLKDMLPSLLYHFKDEEDIIIQQSIALFLVRTAKYESKEIKNRIISLLRIRCEISQDSIICKCLSELS